MAETIDEIFNAMEEHYKPGSFTKETTYYFSLDDEKWTVTLAPDGCTVEEGKTVDEADVFLKTSKDLFLRIYNGEYTPGIGDFLSGRAKSNNPLALKKFVEAFI